MTTKHGYQQINYNKKRYRYLNIWNFRNLLYTRCVLVLYCCYIYKWKRNWITAATLVIKSRVPVKKVKKCIDLLLCLAFLNKKGSVFLTSPSLWNLSSTLTFLFSVVMTNQSRSIYVDVDRRWLRDVSIFFYIFLSAETDLFA